MKNNVLHARTHTHTYQASVNLCIAEQHVISQMFTNVLLKSSWFSMPSLDPMASTNSLTGRHELYIVLRSGDK